MLAITFHTMLKMTPAEKMMRAAHWTAGSQVLTLLVWKVQCCDVTIFKLGIFYCVNFVTVLFLI